MATHTSRYGLSKPENTDEMQSFMSDYADNMDKIDENLGGGGSGGGGNVYGAFLDPSRVIYSAFTFDGSTHSWTATEDCILTDNMTPPDNTTAYFIRIDGKQVFVGYSTVEDPFVYVKKGQVVEYRAKSGSTMKAYGLLQGTNGIFAPVIYSDNERVIGVWRDNKPLYQKTLHATGSYSAGSDVVVPVPANIENLQIVGGFVDIGTDWLPLELTFGLGTPTTNGIYCYPNKTTGIHIYSSAWTFTEYTVTIQYTKTTDVAGSADWNTDGIPTHHYSTSEQVVGTWIDGKPLYEVTVEVDNPTINSYSDNKYIEVPYSSSVIDFAKCVSCVVYDSTDSRWYTLPYERMISSENINLQAMRLANNSFLVTAHWKSNNSYNITKVRYTIQFTKTTD